MRAAAEGPRFVGTKIVMLTAAAQEADVARASPPARITI